MKNLFYALAGVLFFGACDSQQSVNEPIPILPVIISAKVTASQNANGKQGIQYLKIELDPSGAIPELLLVEGKPLFDNGEGSDLIAGDYIYSSLDNVRLSDNNASGRVASVQGYIKCDFDVSGSGGDCGGEKCPDKTAWGNKTWFCVCFTNCSFCWGSDCESN